METTERRNRIMKILCRRRHETVNNLASEIGVSPRTIRRDIEALSIYEPIYTQTGRYYGGIYLMEGYKTDNLYVKENEALVLLKLFELAQNHKKCDLSDAELKVLRSIVLNYIRPQSIEKK